MNTALPAALAIFAILFFAVAALSQWRRIPCSLWEHPAIFALSYLGASGVIFFFGAIEMVGRYGVSGLIGLAAFTGLFIFSPLFLDPMRWISRNHAFATLPDLLVYRFRSPLVTRTCCALLAVASLPIAAAQLKIVTTLLPAGDGLWLMALITAISAAFILLYGKPSKVVTSVPGITSVATLLTLAALSGCGFLAVSAVFGGVAELNAWSQSSGQAQVILRFETAYALILLFFPTAFILPQQGFIQNLSNWWPRSTSPGWIVPLVMLLATLPVFPILWAGLELTLDAPLQHYVLVLPQVLGAPWLHLLSLVAMLFIVTGLLCVTAIALGKVIVIAFLINADKPFCNTDLDRWIERRRLVAALLWLALALAYAAVNGSSSVTDLTITGMIGMIQLLPGIIATLYVPRINYKGFLAGLAVGSSLWLYGTLTPNFFNTAPPHLFGMTLALGPENWPFWLLESLVANLLVALLVSLFTDMSKEEKQYAFQCMVDNLPTPQRQSLEISSVEDIQARLASWVGAPAAAREISAALGTLSIGVDDHRPLALRMLRDQLNYQLSAKLGTVATEKIMNKVMPFGAGAVVDDISLLESQLASEGSALSGLAAELNKLRLYHKQTLENLPVGVCSIDSDGEIMLWNLTLAKYTGVPAAVAEGGNISDIPEPWGTILARFCADPAISWPAHEVDHPSQGASWYHMSKYRVDESSPVYSGYQIVLLEDVTERLKLVRELGHAERLTSVGRLAAGVAHEIGNPVTGISCLAQDMIAESQEEETRKNAGIILNLTERISLIVRTLMDFSRSDSQESLRSIAIKEAVDSAIQLLELDKGAKAVEFRTLIAQDVVVQGDLNQLTQVFVNLLSNARDASQNGDPIDVTCEYPDPRHVAIHISDRGSGIPQEILGRVMDPFFTTKYPGQGTGLGLSLVYSIMRFHRGTVTITSPAQHGRGTRVTLLFDARKSTVGPDNSDTGLQAEK
ncbi:MAG: ATP-binding protein [Porticoccaceae bacterium]